MASAMSGSATSSQKRRVAEAFTTLPVLPNCYPYNEMLFKGQLQVVHTYDDQGRMSFSGPGDGVKTRSWAPKHRGPMLLYTSTTAHRTPCLAWGYDPKKFESMAIVGVGTLVKVEQLDKGECYDMFVAFNNLERFRKEKYKNLGAEGGEPFHKADWLYDFKAADTWAKENGCAPTTPFPNGLFFKNLKRFKKPIAFKPPKGAVSMFRVPLSLAAKALKEVGYRV